MPATACWCTKALTDVTTTSITTVKASKYIPHGDSNISETNHRSRPLRHTGSCKSSDCWRACMCTVKRIMLSMLQSLSMHVWPLTQLLCLSFQGTCTGSCDMKLPTWVLSNLTASMRDCQGAVCAGMHVCAMMNSFKSFAHIVQAPTYCNEHS